MTDTATVQISVTDCKTGQVTLNETFHIAAHLTTALIEQLEAIVAELPPKRVRVSRSQENGATILDFEILSGGGKPRRKSSAGPTYEDRYRRKPEAADEPA